MSIFKIAKIGNPVLRKKAKRVNSEHVKSKEFQRFLDDLVETMRDGIGVGISAPQVHAGVRVIAIENKKNKRYPEKKNFPLEIIINPEIILIDKVFEEDWEGCLSIDLRGLVPRYCKIKYKGFDRKGKLIEGIALGFKARVIQHEVDHLDGILFVDRMMNFASLTTSAEYEKYWKKKEEH